jgi:hypothetical protein
MQQTIEKHYSKLNGDLVDACQRIGPGLAVAGVTIPRRGHVADSLDARN